MQRTQGQRDGRNIGRVALSGVLWLITAALCLACTFALRDFLIWGMAFAIPQPDQATRLRTAQTINFASQCGIVIFGVLAAIVVIGTGEYAFKHAGEPRLLRRLIIISVIEALIVVPVALLLWRGG